jgi:hypothetical protein
MSTYNGHKNWNHWNVSLWINNDEVLYRLAKDCYRLTGSVTKAAESMLGTLQRGGINKTPDGAPYSVSSIKAAMADI